MTKTLILDIRVCREGRSSSVRGGGERERRDCGLREAGVGRYPSECPLPVKL